MKRRAASKRCPNCGGPLVCARCAADDHPLVLLREAHGWSRLDLAQASGVGLRTIERLESRAHFPQMATRRRLLEAVGVELERHRQVFGAFARHGHRGPRARGRAT